MKKNHMKNVNWNVVKMLEKKALDMDPAKHFNPWQYCQALENKMQNIKVIITLSIKKLISLFYKVYKELQIYVKLPYCLESKKEESKYYFMR